MIVFWSGLGILAIPAVIVGTVGPIALEVWLRQQVGYVVPHSLFTLAFAVLPFLALLGLDGLLKRFGPTHTVINRKTGETLEVAIDHTFMFLPLRWCAYVWMGANVLLLGSRLFK